MLVAWHKPLHVIHIPHLGGKPSSQTSFSRGCRDLQSSERPRSDLRKPELKSTSHFQSTAEIQLYSFQRIHFYHLMLCLIQKCTSLSPLGTFLMEWYFFNHSSQSPCRSPSNADAPFRRWHVCMQGTVPCQGLAPAQARTTCLSRAELFTQLTFSTPCRTSKHLAHAVPQIRLQAIIHAMTRGFRIHVSTHGLLGVSISQLHTCSEPSCLVFAASSVQL